MPAAKPQAARGGITTLHIWLIVFVALWLTFTVIAVLLYTGREELVLTARRAEQDAEKYMRKNEAGRFAPFLEVAGDRRSLASVLYEDRSELARLIGVEELVSLPEARKQVDEVISGLGKGAPPGAALRDLKGQGLLAVVNELQAAWKSQAVAAADAAQRLQKASEDLKAAKDQLTGEQKKYNDQVAARDAQIKQLENDKKSYQQEKDRQVKDLQARIIKTRDEADEQLIRAQAELRKAQQQVEQVKADLKRTQEQLTQFRPKVASMGLVTHSDAEIIRAKPEEGVVYVNLGQNDRLMLGLRFQVFSGSKEVDSTGQGKGVIEVVGIQPQTAECRIISSNPIDPIVVGDKAVNVVFDRSRKYRFVVEGLFDIAGTGRSDPQDNDRIKSWIEAWGGEVVDLPQALAKVEKCATCGQPLRQPSLGFETIDFLVLGAPPQAPGKITDETRPEDRARIESQRNAYDRYVKIEQQAKELSVAILTQSQFLNFIGYGGRSKTGVSAEKMSRAAMGR